MNHGRLLHGRFPHAPDVAQGKLDVYGQTSANYVQQSAPHMRAIGRMMHRLLGLPDTLKKPASTSVSTAATPSISNATSSTTSIASFATSGSAAATRTALSGEVGRFNATPTNPTPRRFALRSLPTLLIDRDAILTAGCSNCADFAHQFHVCRSSDPLGVESQELNPRLPNPGGMPLSKTMRPSPQFHETFTLVSRDLHISFMRPSR